MFFFTILHQISDFPKLIDGMAKSLRRNGVLLLCEFDFKVYKSDRTPCYPWGPRQTPDEPTSFLAIWFAVLRNAIRSRGGTVDAPDRTIELLRSHPYFDQESIHIIERWFPFAPYTYTRDFQTIGYSPDRLSGIGDLVRSDVLVRRQKDIEGRSNSYKAIIVILEKRESCLIDEWDV